MAKLCHAEIRTREKAGLPPPSTPVLSDSEPGNKQEEEPTHIAFGSKVVIPKHARKTSREGSASLAGGRSSSGLSLSGSVSQLRTVSPAVEPDSGYESSRQTHRLLYQRSLSDATNVHSSQSSNGQLEIEATQSTMQPRPPRTGSGGKARRRPFKVKHPGSGNVKSRNADDNCVKDKVNGAVSKDAVVEDKDMDSNPETISRSQSESSLKMSGNDSSLSESFNKLKLKIPDKEQNGHNIKNYDSSKEKLTATAEVEKESPPVFTFSSRPRSAPRSPRSRQRRQHDSNAGTGPVEEKPVIQTISQTLDVNDSKSKVQSRSRKDSNRSEYDSDFYKASGESSAEEDDLQNFLKTSGNSRCSSRGSKLSPLPSPSPEPDPLSNSQLLRRSIRSSLLKEVSTKRKQTFSSSNEKQQDITCWKMYYDNLQRTHG